MSFPFWIIVPSLAWLAWFSWRYAWATKKRVKHGGGDLEQGRTVLMIAHRFSSIRHASRILVFDAGRVVADGPHETLHQTSPIYRELYNRQMLGANTVAEAIS